MRAYLISLLLVGTALMSWPATATATELTVPAQRDYAIERPHRVSRTIVRHRHRVYVYKRIGMPCLLTPDEIVRRNWNGPQCRWADNL